MQRLYCIVQAHNMSSVAKNENFREELHKVGSVLEHVTNKKRVMGPGFAGDPFLFVDESDASYVAAACTWLTITSHLQNDLQSSQPNHVAKVYQKYVVTNDRQLLRRIGEDAGDSPMVLLQNMGVVNDNWGNAVFFDTEFIHEMGPVALQRLERNGVGLLSAF